MVVSRYGLQFFSFLVRCCCLRRRQDKYGDLAHLHPVASIIMADADCRTVSLSSKARLRLEVENPKPAMQLYRYLIQLNGNNKE